jgi:ParB family chromosome partitioning protein
MMTERETPPARLPAPQRKGGLGRGLAALIPTAPAQPENTGAPSTGPGPRATSALPMPTVAPAPGASAPTGSGPAAAEPSTPASVGGAVYREIELAAVRPNPHQPRTQFDEEALAELEHSIREFGLLQPIVVREAFPGSYELVMGERRWRAAQRAGLARLPAIVRNTGNDAMLRDALLENIHRVQLNPLDEAAAYEQLLAEFGVTQTELADRLGRSRPVVTNTIRLLKLPVSVQRRVAAGVLSAGHARTEEAVVLLRRESPTSSAKPSRRKQMQAPGLQDLAERLSDAYDTRVKVELGQRKGRIVVEFGSVEDLERIARLMNRADD